MPVIAIDLGGTKLATALFDAQGKVFHKRVVPLQRRKGKQVGKLIQTEVRSAVRAARRSAIKLTGVGVSVPGIAWRAEGCVWAPNIPGWENYPLAKEIKQAMGKPGLPVHMAGDRACYILGETWQGSAQGCKDAVFMAVGTGIGAGILIDGRVLHGAHDIGGAIGWLALKPPFLDKYKPCGCFEYHASGEGLVKVARELLASNKRYTGVLRAKSNLTARDLFAAYESGDLIARKTFETAIQFWGMAVANLVSLFNPEKIVFGGGVFGPASQFLDAILAEAKKWAQPISITRVKLELSRLGGDAGLFGAARLALHESNQE